MTQHKEWDLIIGSVFQLKKTYVISKEIIFSEEFSVDNSTFHQNSIVINGDQFEIKDQTKLA